VKKIPSEKKYTNIAIFLHWSIAICVLMLLLSGFSLHYEFWESKQFVFQLYQLHKSIGVIVLVLVFLRIVWRVINKPPKLPTILESKSQIIHFGHILLYLFLTILPLSGWVLVSTSPEGIPTILFGMVNWLHLPLEQSWHQSAKSIHYYGAFGIIFLILGHIGMTIHHQFSGVELLQRMKIVSGVKIALVIMLTLLILSSMTYLQTQATHSEISIFKSDGVDNQLNLENFIEFSGEHTGNQFNGRFNNWQLETDLNFSEQTMSQFSLVVDISSVSTGSDLYDATLSETDWFNIEEFPQSTYEAGSAEFIDEKTATVEGVFRIKDLGLPLELTLRFDGKSIQTQFELNRKKINLGQQSDPDGDWVSENIEVSAKVELIQ